MSGRRSSAAKSLAPVFAALGDETRLEMVARLSEGEPLSITQLAAGVSVSRQAVTKHLHVLADAGVLRGIRHGREQLWELTPHQLLEARRCLERIGGEWDRALSRLQAFVEEEE